MLKNVPKSLFGPLGDEGRILAVICLALAFGIALKRLHREKVPGIEIVDQLINVTFAALVIVLHWILEVIPLAAFGIVAAVIGTKGFSAFLGLGAFELAFPGHQLGMVLGEGLGDVLEEDQAEDDVLVLGGVHVVTELVGGEPEFGFEADGGARVLLARSSG